MRRDLRSFIRSGRPAESLVFSDVRGGWMVPRYFCARKLGQGGPPPTRQLAEVRPEGMRPSPARPRSVADVQGDHAARQLLRRGQRGCRRGGAPGEAAAGEGSGAARGCSTVTGQTSSRHPLRSPLTSSAATSSHAYVASGFTLVRTQNRGQPVKKRVGPWHQIHG
jgi:hypothetical protein